MFKTKGVEEIKTLILCSITSPPPPPQLYCVGNLLLMAGLRQKCRSYNNKFLILKCVDELRKFVTCTDKYTTTIIRLNEKSCRTYQMIAAKLLTEEKENVSRNRSCFQLIIFRTLPFHTLRETVQRPTTVYFSVSLQYATARFSAPLTWHGFILLYEHMDVSLSAELNVMTT